MSSVTRWRKLFAKKCLQFYETLIRVRLDVTSRCATPLGKCSVSGHQYEVDHRQGDTPKHDDRAKRNLDRLRSPTSGTSKSGNLRLPGGSASLPLVPPLFFTLHGLASSLCGRAVMRMGHSGPCESAKTRPVADLFCRQVQYRGI